MATEIVPGIFTFTTGVVEGNTGLVCGGCGVLAVDAGFHPSEGQALADFVRQRGTAPPRLVYTHGHCDHVLGSGAFAGAEVFAHAGTEAGIRRQLENRARQARTTAAGISGTIAWPTVTFSGQLRLDLGGRQVRLLPSPGHSDDSLCVWVEPERLLFAGDTVNTCIVPAIGDGDSGQLEQSLRDLMTLDIRILVPGHGPCLQGPETIREWLTWVVNYLAGIRALVRHCLGQGQPPEEVIPAAGYFEFVGDRLSAGQYDNAGRHRKAVKKIIEEVLKKLYIFS